MKTILILAFLALLPHILHAQSDTSLVRLRDIDSTILQDVRYASNNNFTGKILYPRAEIYLRKEVALKLSLVQAHLRTLGYRIKIFDGYRPFSVQKLLWNATKLKRYVANPAKGSKHNRGVAVDVTIVNSQGMELDMGSEFDSFSEKSGRGSKLPPHIRNNRTILITAMRKYGFIPNSREWWHFDYSGWRRYRVMDWKWW